MRRISLTLAGVLGVLIALILFRVSYAPQARMDAYVKAAHPSAWEIERIGNEDMQIYILCDGGKVRLIRANRGLFTADIMHDVELPADHASCK